LSTVDSNLIEKFYTKAADCFEKARRSEERVASDEDLKLSDTLRYWMRETAASKVNKNHSIIIELISCLITFSRTFFIGD